jgi:adenosylcobinamide-GDP ribazoletransferase
VIGALIGLGVGGAWWAGTEVWNPLVGAALAVVVDLALTGMLHVDGLADSADGLLPHLGSKERRLEVMRQPDVGAFGVATVAGVLLLELAAFTAMDVDVRAVVAVWALTRALCCLPIGDWKYARPGGLGEAFTGDRGLAVVVMMCTVPVATVIGGPTVMGAFGASAAVLYFGRWRLGGWTGDVLGASIVIGQVVGLLAAAA